MELDPGFSYSPTPPVPPPAPQPTPAPAPPPGPDASLGLLESLLGTWSGTGLNIIWRPKQPASGSDHFLEINVTEESLEFERIPGDIPNRGFLQPDLQMAGMRYLQQVKDSNLAAGLHAEPGVWLSIPTTSDPALPATVARSASVPHGTVLIAQGLALNPAAGGPNIPGVSIAPYSIGDPAAPLSFPEQTLSTPSDFRTTGLGLNGVTQEMLDNPNTVLATTSVGIHVTSTVAFQVSSDSSTPVLRGGLANTAFLQGGSDGPNADAAPVTATSWLQTIEGSQRPDLLQYTQTVLLNFNGISWPHVSVATLRRVPAKP